MSGAVPRTCSDCDKPITPKSASGFCKPCLLTRRNRDPEFQARRLARLREACTTEEFRSKVSAAQREINSRPGFIEKRRINASRNAFRTIHSENGRRGFYSETTREKLAAAQRDKFIRDLPEEWRAEYRRLMRHAHGMTMAKAKQIIAERRAAQNAEHAAQERERLAEMTPFERQMEALKNGARLIEKQHFTRTYDYTLGGVSAL